MGELRWQRPEEPEEPDAGGARHGPRSGPDVPGRDDRNQDENQDEHQDEHQGGDQHGDRRADRQGEHPGPVPDGPRPPSELPRDGPAAGERAGRAPPDATRPSDATSDADAAGSGGTDSGAPGGADWHRPRADIPYWLRRRAERYAPGARYTWREFELEDEPPHAAPHPPDAPDLRDGRRDCGAVEGILYRQWDPAGGAPSPEVIRAVDRLAELPRQIQERLADGLDGIYVGSGAVPDLDDMEYLRGHPLPGGRASWDICAGSYGDRKIVVGDRPSPTPDVMMHEVGHALDDVDAPTGEWLSDQDDFRRLYEQCLPHLGSDFHRQPAGIGRREFFADAFAAIASRQRPALLDMLGGDTRTALAVMLYFNKRYGM